MKQSKTRNLQCDHRDNVSTPDAFEWLKDNISIPQIWERFGFKEQPSVSCKSPFRDDQHASFSIYNDGRNWKDFATDEGGDVIEFIKHALDGSYKEVSEWIRNNYGFSGMGHILHPRKRKVKNSSVPVIKSIQWPGKLTPGKSETWEGFARFKDYLYPSVWVMVHAGLLSFCRINNEKCFVVKDESNRAAEIRKLNGQLFYKSSKAYPLKGVDKSWLIGSPLLKDASQETSILLCEGATDFLKAIDLYTRYRKLLGGRRSWVPTALLGSMCRKIDPECAELFKGRLVRIASDADNSGNKMADHWKQQLHTLGCEVETIEFAQGMDLTEASVNFSPNELYS